MVSSMKTTIDLPDELAAEAKELARAEGTTLRELVVDGLRFEIERRRAPDDAEPFHFPTFKGDGLVPGVGPHNWIDISYGFPPE